MEGIDDKSRTVDDSRAGKSNWKGAQEKSEE